MTIAELATILGLELGGIAVVWIGGAYALKAYIVRQNRKRSMQ